jgi:catechol 2,3-dioxygenase-like lactoylglutathione lyase family enzyme
LDILGIDHFTLRVAPEQLPVLRRFYVEVLGLREGARADFDFPGHWLYAGAQAAVHLAGNQPEGEAAVAPELPTGRFNHVALRARGLAAARARLLAHGIAWRESPVPGLPVHQLFLRDPAGLQIELSFDAAELAAAGPTARPQAA